jgi:CubicO group peptidase (beta-lactamase class C family)
MSKPTQAIQGFDPRRLQRIDDVIARNYVATGALPGALSMVWRRGELVWRGASGVLDLGRGSCWIWDAARRSGKIPSSVSIP